MAEDTVKVASIQSLQRVLLDKARNNDGSDDARDVYGILDSTEERLQVISYLGMSIGLDTVNRIEAIRRSDIKGIVAFPEEQAAKLVGGKSSLELLQARKQMSDFFKEKGVRKITLKITIDFRDDLRRFKKTVDVKEIKIITELIR